LFSPGGAGSQPSPHSVVAEIPDPSCVAGRNGAVTGASAFLTQLTSTRAKFLQQFPNITAGWNDAGGRRVRLTGIGFVDPDHGQVGRALNGLELHPLLDIEFDSATTPPPPPNTLDLPNADFESGSQGWTATADVITTAGAEPAHSGQGMAWLGGYGQTHT